MFIPQNKPPRENQASAIVSQPPPSALEEISPIAKPSSQSDGASKSLDLRQPYHSNHLDDYTAAADDDEPLIPVEAEEEYFDGLVAADDAADRLFQTIQQDSRAKEFLEKVDQIYFKKCLLNFLIKNPQFNSKKKIDISHKQKDAYDSFRLTMGTFTYKIRIFKDKLTHTHTHTEEGTFKGEDLIKGLMIFRDFRQEGVLRIDSSGLKSFSMTPL